LWQTNRPFIKFYTWDDFVKEYTTHYDKLWENDYFSHRTKIRQTVTTQDYTLQQQRQATCVMGLNIDKLLELDIGGLCNEI
jgi:hypothetical protein